MAGMRRMVDKSLDRSVAASFLKDLKDTGVEYNVSVDPDGHTVIYPVERRQFDFTQQDAGLRKCVDAHFGKMKLAMESNKYGSSSGVHKVRANLLTVDDLVSQGAMGHAAEEYVL